ncbi:twin-arginine translocase subunit TatC [Paenibacillus sp. FSL H8-0537]|uniref:twin-arginine translocase subunit TatC n=1 Tax=Paenibacillus sp. FSL H8-0537 TaxID=2921399 RepID=UPI003100DBF6
MGIRQDEATEQPFNRERLREEGLMPLLEHVGELRKRIFYMLLVILVGLIAGLFVAKPAYDFIMSLEPARSLPMHTFSLWDGVGVYMKFALVIALIITIPFTAYQLWAFVKPALHVKEQRATLKYIPFALLMFLVGLSFSYFVVFPLAFHFTRNISDSLDLVETFGIIQYFTFMFNILIPISLLFELPLVIMFLTAIRILNPIRLRKMRRISYFIMIFIGVLVTPPDFVSDALVAIPLLGLYEMSVFLSAAIYRRQLAADKLREEEMNEEAS